MNSLVIYDSNYGNTKQVAQAVAKELRTRAIAVSEKPKLENLDLIVVGSPINGWRPSAKMLEFLASLKENQLAGVKAATFDTRVKLFIHGDAAGKIAKALERAGAQIITNPQPFYVKGKEGDLYEGELEKASEWGRKLNR